MTIETASYINGLNVAYPESNSPKSEGDDHIRLLKSTIKATFPNVAGAVNPTQVELNYLVGVTSLVQTQINGKGAITGQTWTGTHTFPATTYGVTATLGDSSLKFATTEFVTNTAFSSALPAQLGNSGKYLKTDGTAATWSALPPTIGVGGGTYTGSKVLTSADQGAITITTTANAQYVQLPVMTTVQKAASLFKIKALGKYPLWVVDSSGNKVSVLNGGDVCNIGCNDNSGANTGIIIEGGRVFGVEYSGVISLPSTLANTPSDQVLKVIPIDADREALIFSANLSTSIAIYSKSAGGFGASFLLSTLDRTLRVTGVSDGGNQIMVAIGADSVNPNDNDRIRTFLLQLSGNTISSSTYSDAVATASSAGKSVYTNGVFCMNMPAGTLRAIKLSGTTQTLIGTQTGLGSSIDVASSGVLVSHSADTAGSTSVTSYTVSPSAIAIGNTVSCSRSGGTSNSTFGRLSTGGYFFAAYLNGANAVTYKTVTLSGSTLAISAEKTITTSSLIGIHANELPNNKVAVLMIGASGYATFAAVVNSANTTSPTTSTVTNFHHLISGGTAYPLGTLGNTAKFSIAATNRANTIVSIAATAGAPDVVMQDVNGTANNQQAAPLLFATRVFNTGGFASATNIVTPTTSGGYAITEGAADYPINTNLNPMIPGQTVVADNRITGWYFESPINSSSARVTKWSIV